MTTRRTFIALTSSAAIWPSGLGAQRSGRLPCVGILLYSDPKSDSNIGAFLRSFGDLGYTDGQNVALVYRFAERQAERFTVSCGATLPFKLAAELNRRRDDADAVHKLGVAHATSQSMDLLMGGAPGIHSARYAGSGADDAANNAKLLGALAGTPPGQRRARYRCALVFIRGATDPAPLLAEGVWEGQILDTPRGSGGFGYDPYFFLPELGMTAAQLDAAAKNRLSHRSIAMRAMCELLVASGQAAVRA